MSEIAPSVTEPVEIAKRKSMTTGRRGRIIARQGHLCARCDGRFSVFEIDHVLALELGGADEDANLQALCGPCHRAKTNTDAGMIARAKRLARKADPATRPKSQRPLKGRGFVRGHKRRKLNGEVVDR